MINKIKFKNYKSFKDEQELEIKPLTVLIGKNSAGKSAITKLPSLISNALSGNFSEPLQWINDGVELGGEFRDLIYGRTRLGKLELTMEDENESLEVIIGSEARATDKPEIFSWTLVNKFGTHHFDITNEKSFDGLRIKGGEEKFQISSLKLATDYIGPFRALPERQYTASSKTNINEIGIRGENAYPILIKDALTTEKKLINQINSWYIKNFDGWGLRINEDTEPFYQLEITRETAQININIRDVGQGMSQVLPIVTRAFMSNEEEKLIVVEQPELHLHPAAHGDIAEMFFNSLQNGNKKYLIETHSQNFVLRLRSLVASKKLSPDDIALYYVHFDSQAHCSKLKKIRIDDAGNVDEWPTGIFNETLLETIAIKNAQVASR